MRFVSLVALPLALIAAPPAFSKGCLRGAAAGAIGGHFVGKGHALLGAAAGCAVAHHHYAKQARTAAALPRLTAHD
ncbi:hypothetical protein [Sphingomonas sp. RS2018]